MLSEWFDSWLGRHTALVDSSVAVTAALMCVWIEGGGRGGLVSVALTLPLALRRTKPVLSSALVFNVAFLQWLLTGDSLGPRLADFAVPAAVYSVTAFGPRWAGRLALAAGLLGTVLMSVTAYDPSAGLVEASEQSLILAAAVLAPWAFGALRGVRRERLEDLAERARLLEVEQDQQSRLAVSAERARIAREMHDVVAHSLTVVIAQADGGRYAGASSPAAAQTALETIGETGRQALAEMRLLLGVLRHDTTGDAPESHGESLLPQPSIEQLPELVERVRSGGLDVRLNLQPPVGPVEPGLGLIVYRIVQEGLTNVIKHAGPEASADVAVRWGPRELEIDVLDDGRGCSTAPAPDGHGVIGMRERVVAYGGTLTVGPRNGGGHALHARIPVPA
ncbi:MAG: sensor histidine kinase [Kineosporiaceae bacterium]